MAVLWTFQKTHLLHGPEARRCRRRRRGRGRRRLFGVGRRRGPLRRRRRHIRCGLQLAHQVDTRSNFSSF